MGLFSKKPVLPDYKGMPVEERMKDPAWYDVVSRVPGFSDAKTVVINADNGNIMGFNGLTDVDAGILTITPERVGYVRPLGQERDKPNHAGCAESRTSPQGRHVHHHVR